MTRVLALADQSKIGCITQGRCAKVGTKTHPQRGADLDRNGLSVSTETACRFEPKSPVGNSEICNFGLTRMAEACSIASLRQLAWTADWHIRDETYALALRRLVDEQQREPLAAMFGSGFASSSDGQFFRAGGFGRDASSINAHYGDEPGVKFYTHLSDRYAPFHTKVIAATASEAAHVLDGLLYHQSEVVARRHHTDGGGDSDHVFALCSLLGFQFAPR